MSELWNLWDLKPPPVCTVKAGFHVKDINTLKDVTFKALQTFRNLSVLDKEAAILSRFLYKHKRVFRHDKGLQNLVKVNQCLRRYLKLGLSEVLLSFKQSLPHKLPPSAIRAYLPTRQMLKWILLRLQAFSQLFARIIRLSKEAGTYVYQKMCLGWSLNLSLMVFSMLARFLVLSKFAVAKSIEWYSSYYKCLPSLKETADFLPGYTFPPDLKKWLESVDLTSLKKKSVIDNIFELIDLSKEDEDDEISHLKIMNEKFIESIFKMKVKIDTAPEEMKIEEEKEERKGVKRLSQSSLQEDLGVPVDDEEEIFNGPSKKKKRRNKEFKNLARQRDMQSVSHQNRSK